jgi:HSP20 family protein
MALVRWDPVRELAGMEIERLNRMFSDFYNEGIGRGWTPAVDIYESDDHALVLKADLPDVKREDISVTVENNVLTLRAERRLEQTIARDRFQRMERHYGAFSRSFTLPTSVDAGAIHASHKDGVLTIRLPQRAEAKPKQITIGAE